MWTVITPDFLWNAVLCKDRLERFDNFRRFGYLIHFGYLYLAREIINHYQVRDMIEFEEISCSHLPPTLREGSWHEWLWPYYSVPCTDFKVTISCI